jgi:hypothetical protein
LYHLKLWLLSIIYLIITVAFIYFTQIYVEIPEMEVKMLYIGLLLLLLFDKGISSECNCTQPWKPEYGNWNKFCGRELTGDCIPDALYNCTLGETVGKKLFECRHRVSKPKHSCSPYLATTCTMESTKTSLGPSCLAKRGCFPRTLMIIGMEERYGKGNHSFS